jgi:hypothetical protein
VNWSFRLIDFGRSKHVGDAMDAARMDGAGVARWQRGVTSNPFL